MLFSLVCLVRQVLDALFCVWIWSDSSLQKNERSMSDRIAWISPEAWYVSVVFILHYDFLNYQRMSSFNHPSVVWATSLIDYLREFTQDTFLLCASGCLSPLFKVAVCTPITSPFKPRHEHTPCMSCRVKICSVDGWRSLKVSIGSHVQSDGNPVQMDLGT